MGDFCVTAEQYLSSPELRTDPVVNNFIIWEKFLLGLWEFFSVFK